MFNDEEPSDKEKVLAKSLAYAFYKGKYPDQKDKEIAVHVDEFSYRFVSTAKQILKILEGIG